MPMARKEHKRTPKIIGRTLYTEAESVALDSPAWFAWLSSHTTFYLDSPDGSFTARCEARGGALFWYAFRRSRKKLSKVYLGRAEDLCYARLLRAAQALRAKAGA